MPHESSIPSIEGQYSGKDIVSVDQFNRTDIEILFDHVNRLDGMSPEQRKHELAKTVIALGFYQPSTRTIFSFKNAADVLGAETTHFQGMDYSSVSKGETLEDTLLTFEAITDAFDGNNAGVVLRHPDNDSALRAANAVDIPIFNGGSGTGEHPTQALLDLYTIHNEVGRMDALNVVLAGDLLYGRTVHSLAKLLSNFKANHLILASPEILRLPQEYLEVLDETGQSYEIVDTLGEALPTADVLYMTRVQREWFKRLDKMDEYEAVKDDFVLTLDMLDIMKPDASIMHPLPRVNEIDRRIDSDARAAYFRQIANGVKVRAALMSLVLGKQP